MSICIFVPVLLPKSQMAMDSDFNYTPFFVVPAVSGFIMNALVLILVGCNRKLRTKPFLFLISITAADAIFPLYGLLKVVDRRFNVVLSPTELPDLRVMKYASCFAVPYLEISIQSTLVLSLMAVTLERYVVICKPLRAKHILTRRRCRYCIAIIWIISFGLGFIKPFSTIFTTSCNRPCKLPQMDIILFKFLQAKTVSCNRFCDENKLMYQVMLCEYKSRATVAYFRFAVLFAMPFLCMLIAYGQVIYALWISHTTQLDLTQASCRRAIMKQAHDKQRLQRHSTISNTTSITTLGSSFTSSMQSIFSKAVEECSNNVDRKQSLKDNATLVGAQHIVPMPTSARKQQIVTEISQSRKKLIKMLVLIMVIFFFCYCPDVSTEIALAIKTEDNQIVLNNDASVGDNDQFYNENEQPHNVTTENVDYPYNNPNQTFSVVESCQDLEKHPTLFSNETSDQISANNHNNNLDMWDWIKQFSRVVMLLHSTLNPLMYFFFSKDLRSALLKTRNLCSFKLYKLLCC